MKKGLHDKLKDAAFSLLLTGMSFAAVKQAYQTYIPQEMPNIKIILDYDGNQKTADSLMASSSAYNIDNSSNLYSPSNIYAREHGIQFSHEDSLKQKRIKPQIRTRRTLEQFYGKQITQDVVSNKGNTHTYTFDDNTKIVMMDK